MLMEEVAEFLTATDLPNRIKELCDIAFVWYGTEAKAEEQEILPLEIDALLEWVAETGRYFYRSVFKEIAQVVDEECDICGLLIKCLDFVIEANEAKGTEKDANGKVIKGTNYKKPEPLIAELIQEYSK